MKYTNKLIHSTSPYLLQHAHNPVNWRPWEESALEKAKEEGRLILVSIGYAACHWCHVMEHESFEDEGVAKVMNENFVCIKVDREERPDVDQYYMSAVQLMGLQGGWPLNVIALPDGRPIWGGTYFPKETWIKNLLGVAGFYKKNRKQTVEYAEKLQNGIEQNSLVEQVKDVIPANAKLLERAVDGWKEYFDMAEGGRLGQPKFPMPVNLEFLLYFGFINKDETCLQFVKTTLEKMARGGIYDQLGGGFARYSVDDKWKVPHFEKMLYDNGQLLSVYSKGFQQFENEEFKTVVYETVDFLERELMDESGAFYSSLDADSEGEEGKFYIWSKPELEEVLGNDFQLFSKYYNVGSKGFWELGNNILLRDKPDEEFAQENQITIEELRKKVTGWKQKLMKVRSQRIRPGLDDKTLTSWNALVIQGLIDAYKAFSDKRFLHLALKNATFLKKNQVQKNGELFHNWKNGKNTIGGFLEDYALLIQAFISLFEVTGNEEWLVTAELMLAYTFSHFFDQDKSLFYFSEMNQKSVVANHFQNEDNVVPSSNSVMANNLHRLYLINGKPDYLTIAKKMILYITPLFPKYPMAYANWGTLMLKLTEPFFEVVVCGNNVQKSVQKLQNSFYPNVLLVFTEKQSEIVLLKNRYQKNKNLIYVCRNGVCKLPVETVGEAISILEVE